MRCLVAVGLLWSAFGAHAGIVGREAGETAQAFALRVGPPGATLAHPAIETDAWHLDGKVLLAFYAVEVKDEASSTPRDVVDGVAWLPTGDAGRYRRVDIGRIEPEGAAPEIRSVFFANADRDPGPELVVIVGWEQRHYDVSGTLYGTLIYARQKTASGTGFTYLEPVSRKVSGGCECDFRDAPSEHSPFRTAAEVRRGLRSLGFK
jgi:hypothetical protein